MAKTLMLILRLRTIMVWVDMMIMRSYGLDIVSYDDHVVIWMLDIGFPFPMDWSGEGKISNKPMFPEARQTLR